MNVEDLCKDYLLPKSSYLTQISISTQKSYMIGHPAMRKDLCWLLDVTLDRNYVKPSKRGKGSP